MLRGVELLDLEQAAPDAAAQLRLREVLEDELGRGLTRRARASESPTSFAAGGTVPVGNWR